MTRTAAPRAAPKRQSPAVTAKKPMQASPAPALATPGRLTKAAATINRHLTDAGSKKTKPKPKTRRDKKGLVLYVAPGVTVALRRLALDTGDSVQTLGMIALNMLFKAHGREQFAIDVEAP